MVFQFSWKLFFKFILPVLFVLASFIPICKSGYFTDIEKCRFTELGKEYVGTINQTENGNICQHWKTIPPTFFEIPNHNFRDYSTLTENFCRNPNNLPKGPGCLVKNKWEYCNVPFCIREIFNCKDTADGNEYSGTINISRTGKMCSSWKPHINLTNSTKGRDIEISNNYCRNINNSINGPWCYLSNQFEGTESCNIPMCSEDLSQQEYFGKADIFKEIVNHTRFITFKKLVDYATVSVKIRWEHFTLRIQRKMSIWSTDYNHYCQRDLDKYSPCDLIQIRPVTLKVEFNYICRFPLKTVVIISPVHRYLYDVNCFPGPKYTVNSDIPPRLSSYNEKVRPMKISVTNKIPLLKYTGYFVLLLKNAIPYAVSDDHQVTVAVSEIGKGYLGFIANENYLNSEYFIYFKEFFLKMSKKYSNNILTLNEKTLYTLEEDIENKIVIWNPHQEFNLIPIDYLLTLISNGLKLVVCISPWLYDQQVERLTSSNLRNLFLSAGLWPSLNTVKKDIRLLKGLEYSAMPLSYLFDYAMVDVNGMNKVSDFIYQKLFDIPSHDYYLVQSLKPIKSGMARLFAKYIHLSRLYTPCLKHPVRRNQKTKRNLIKMMNSFLLFPMGNSFEAPGISFYPGTMNSKISPDESFKLKISLKFSDEVIFLGFYLPYGQIMEVKPDIAKLKTCTLYINYHLLDVWDHDVWYKWPQTRLNFKLYAGENLQTSFSFGGLLSLSCDENNDVVHLILSGVVRIPYFDTRFISMFNYWPNPSSGITPWVMLANDASVFVLPSISMRNLFNPETILSIWNRMIKQEFHLKGYDISKHRREIISTDFQILSGYMHSGYPIGTLMQFVINPRLRQNYLLNYSHIKKYGNWGLLHEVGHNLQDSIYTFEGTEEVTNNIFTLAAIEDMARVNIWSETSEWINKNVINSIMKYLRHGSFNNWKRNPFIALGIYAQLKHHFGWEFYRQLFRHYNKLVKSKKIDRGNLNDSKKIQLWITESSRICQMNLLPLYEFWRFPIDNNTRRELVEYPFFFPQDFLTSMANERTAAITALYGRHETVLRKPLKIKDFVGPLLNDTQINGYSPILWLEKLKPEE